MQYTGLKDVAGKDIYEGDILGMENATAKVVFWNKPPEFGLDFSHNEGEWCEDWNLSDDHDRMEIIGNIYEHPELLREEDGSQ
jgi:YopX protein.